MPRNAETELGKPLIFALTQNILFKENCVQQSIQNWDQTRYWNNRNSHNFETVFHLSLFPFCAQKCFALLLLLFWYNINEMLSSGCRGIRALEIKVGFWESVFEKWCWVFTFIRVQGTKSHFQKQLAIRSAQKTENRNYSPNQLLGEDFLFDLISRISGVSQLLCWSLLMDVVRTIWISKWLASYLTEICASLCKKILLLLLCIWQLLGFLGVIVSGRFVQFWRAIAFFS